MSFDRFEIQDFKGPRTFLLRGAGIPLLYIEQIPLFWSFLFNSIILDLSDCPLGTFTGLLSGKPERCDTGFDYQLQDKTMDVLVDLAALNVLLKDNRLTKEEKDFFILLFTLRLLGVIMYFITKDEKWLIIFPHFFQIVFLYRYAFETFDFLSEFNPWSSPAIWWLIGLLVLKVIQEIIWHKTKKFPGIGKLP